MKLSISSKYGLAFGVISFVVTGVIAVSFITLLARGGAAFRKQVEKTEHEIYEESQGKTNYNLANYLSSYLFVPLYQLDINGVNRLIRDMKEALPIDFFVIADPSGIVLTDGTKQNLSYGKRLKLDRLWLKKNYVSEENEQTGQRITFAIRAGAKIAGYGQIVFSHAPLRSAIQRHRDNLSSTWNAFMNDFIRVSLSGLIIVLLVAAFLSVLFSRTLSRPLISLKNAADRVAQGDLGHRVAIDSDDEIGELAASFNRMVSDMKISTERLQDANEKLRTLDRMKSEFISVVSHELRTPITSIKAFAELILMKPSMPPEKKTRFLEVVKSESERLARLINDVLDLTRIENGELHWHIDRLSLADVIRHSVSSIEPLAYDKDLSISVVLDPQLPELSGDKDRLVQVVTNILSNAVKFTPSGGSVRISAFPEQAPLSAVRVSISDTGVGIPEDSLHLIFEKFHRAGDGLSNSVEGTGLGLAIARQIVEHHGGSIFAKSGIAAGTTITFTLPLQSQLGKAAVFDKK